MYTDVQDFFFRRSDGNFMLYVRARRRMCACKHTAMSNWAGERVVYATVCLCVCVQCSQRTGNSYVCVCVSVCEQQLDSVVNATLSLSRLFQIHSGIHTYDIRTHTLTLALTTILWHTDGGNNTDRRKRRRV